MALHFRMLTGAVFVSIALFMLASVPAAEASESPDFVDMADAAELVAVDDTESMTGNSAIPEPDRPKMLEVVNYEHKINQNKVTTSKTETPFGGAVGLANFGIRGTPPA